MEPLDNRDPDLSPNPFAERLPDDPGPRPATAAELAALASRVEDFVTGYLEIGEKLGVEPEPELILAVIDRCLAHAEERAWDAEPVRDEVERQFLQSLFEELNQEREGLYDHWFDARGAEQFAPIPAATWVAVLRLLRGNVERVLEG